MKINFILTFGLICISILSCKKAEVLDSGEYYTLKPITYDMEIININPDDQFKSEGLKEFSNIDFANYILEGVYAGKLIAFDINTKKKLSISDVKEIEAGDKYDRSKISLLWFTETWKIDKSTYKLIKEIESYTMGYAGYYEDGKFKGHYPAFGVRYK